MGIIGIAIGILRGVKYYAAMMNFLLEHHCTEPIRLNQRREESSSTETQE